jgi:PIN domain nuclease of toxin-antitoxin system
VKLLLDTHAALFMWMDRSRLSPTARTLLESPGNTVVFSQVSTWEICLKYHTGKLPLPEPPRRYLPKRLRQSELAYEPIADEAVFRTVELPSHHHDPFDRLLIATALILKVPILSADAAFRRYSAEVIW